MLQLDLSDVCTLGCFAYAFELWGYSLKLLSVSQGWIEAYINDVDDLCAVRSPLKEDAVEIKMCWEGFKVCESWGNDESCLAHVHCWGSRYSEVRI